MAISTEAIRKITIQGSTQGVVESTAALNDLTDAQKKLATASDATATVTDISSKRQLSAAQAYQRQTLSVVDGARAQEQLGKSTKIVDDALRQGIITQAEHATRIELLNQKYGEASKVSQAWSQSLVVGNPLLQARSAMEEALTKQTTLGSNAVRLGIVSQAQAAVQLENVRQQHLKLIDAIQSHEKEEGKIAQVATVVESRMAGMGASMGMVGTVLQVIGPLGMVAAAVLGAVALEIYHMVQEANRMGESAIAMRTFSETTQTSISQIKTLSRAGAELGVGTDTIASSIDKFTVKLEAARLSSGPLYDAVRLIDSGLAKELAATTTTAQGWDVLARARAMASDQSKGALSQAAFGRGGFTTGLVLDVTAEAGGLDALVAKQQKLNGLTDEQIKKWADTKVQIDETQKRTANLMAATYTQEVLDRQLQAAQLEERITRAIVAANAERQKRPYLSLLSETLDTNPSTSRETATANLTAAFSTEQKPDLSGYDALAKKLWEVVDAEKAEQDQKKKERDAAVSAANLMKEEIGFLGSAATADEKLTLRLKELLAARLSNAASQETYNRAVAAANIDTLIAKQIAHNAVLGGAASVTDIMTEKTNALAKARQQDSTLTDAQIANSARLAREQANGVAAVNAHIDSIKIQNGAMGLAAGAAAEYTVIETRRLENERLGRKDDDESTRALKERAAALRAVIESSPQAAVTEWKNYISVIGSAATPQERLNAAIAELTLKAKEAGREGEQLAKGISALVTDAVIAQQNTHNAALGASATVTDIVKAKTLELQKAQQQGAGLTDVQVANVNRLNLAQADGTFALQAQINATKVQTATIGMGVGAAEAYQIIQTKINENLNARKPALDGVSAGFIKLATSAGTAKQAEAELKAQNDATFALQTVFLSQIDQQIAQVQRQLHQNDWPKYMNDGLSATLRLADSFKVLKDAAGTFASGLTKDLANGVPAVEALQTALKTLASSVLDAAVKRLVDQALSGLASAITGAAGGAAAGASQAATMTTGATTAAGILTTAGTSVAAAIIAGATEAAGILGLSVPAAAATLPVAGTVAATEIAAGSVAGGAALVAGATAVEVSAFTLSAAMGPIGLAFAAIAAAAALFGLSGSSKGDTWLKGQIDGMNQRNFDYANRAAMVGVDTNTRQGAILAQDAQFVKERIAENKSGGQAMNALLQVQVQERNQLLKDWDQKDTDLVKANADAKLAIEKAAADRSLGFQDRLFAATNDFSTLEGQLAAFDRTAQQDRAKEVEAGGQAIVDLESAQAAERLKVIQDSNAKIVADTQAAAKAQQDALNSAAKNIVDYVKNLSAGPGSTDSPQNVLNAAQAAYNAKLALAIGGDVNAQSTITQDAENLRLAARAFYASGTGYQDILLAIKTQLLALPAVQNTTDPVVAAMRDVLTAINAGNAAQALDATLQGVIKAAIDAGNAQQIATLLIPKFDTLNVTTGLGLNFADFVSGLGPSYSNLAKNTTVAGLLTQAQITALGLSKDITTGALFTNAQLTAAGLSKDTTVGNLLTSTQLGTLGLSKDSTVGQVQSAIGAMDTGNLLNVFNQLAGSNGLIAKTDLIKVATQNTNTSAYATMSNTANTNANITGVNNNTDATNALLNVIKGLDDTSKSFLSGINTFADRIIQAINAQGVMQAGNFNQMILNSAVLLNWMPKLVTTGKEGAGGDGGGGSTSFPYTAHAAGGVIPPYGLGLVSEHLNPTWVRAGNEPVMVSPFAPVPSFRAGNDNGFAALVSEVRQLRSEGSELRKEVVRLQNIVSGSDAMTRQSIEKTGDKLGDKFDEQTDKLGAQQRQSDRQHKVANG